MSMRLHFRRLLRSKVFAGTAVLILGFGLGVNMVLFNAVYALLWRPLAFLHSDQLVTLHGRGKAGDWSEWITGSNAWALRRQTDLLAAMGVVRQTGPVTLSYEGTQIELTAVMVDSGYCRALALQPVAGRLFGEEEDIGGGAELPVLLTESAWKRHFGGDPEVVQQLVERQGSGRGVRIVGVLPSGITLPFASEAEVLLPVASASGAVQNNFGDAVYRSVARIQQGTTLASASSAADAALQATEQASPHGVWGRHWFHPLRAALAPVNRQTILWLYGSACLLLLLTCANVASLVAARAIAQSHETNIQLALGARRGQMVLARFQEALILCVAGTVLAFFVEAWSRPLILFAIPELKRVGAELLATGPVLIAFGFAACLCTALVVSYASLWRLNDSNLHLGLSQGGRCLLPAARPLRAGLSSAQLAIVLALLMLAGLAGRSFLAATDSDAGLDARDVVTLRAVIPPPSAAIPTVTALASQLEAIPGVRRVAYAAELPVGTPAFSTTTAAHTGALTPSDPMISYRLVSAGYFETIGARLAAGRSFTAEEVEQGRAAVVLNQSAARLLFGNRNPLGQIVHSGFMDRRSVVAGIVNDIQTEGLDRPPVPIVYMGYRPGWGLRFLVRTESSAQAFASMARERVRGWNTGVTLHQFRALQDTLDDTVRGRIVAASLVGGFALLGLLISSVGLYGALAGHVEQRSREIAVRMALGASAQSVVSNVLQEGGRIVFTGAAAGVIGAVVLGHLVRNQLYGVTPLDPLSFCIALFVLTVATLAACLLPALRASRIDPARMLNLQ